MSSESQDWYRDVCSALQTSKHAESIQFDDVHALVRLPAPSTQCLSAEVSLQGGEFHVALDDVAWFDEDLSDAGEAAQEVLRIFRGVASGGVAKLRVRKTTGAIVSTRFDSNDGALVVVSRQASLPLSRCLTVTRHFQAHSPDD